MTGLYNNLYQFSNIVREISTDGGGSSHGFGPGGTGVTGGVFYTILSKCFDWLCGYTYTVDGVSFTMFDFLCFCMWLYVVFFAIHHFVMLVIDYVNGYETNLF